MHDCVCIEEQQYSILNCMMQLLIQQWVLTVSPSVAYMLYVVLLPLSNSLQLETSSTHAHREDSRKFLSLPSEIIPLAPPANGLAV